MQNVSDKPWNFDCLPQINIIINTGVFFHLPDWPDCLVMERFTVWPATESKALWLNTLLYSTDNPTPPTYWLSHSEYFTAEVSWTNMNIKNIPHESLFTNLSITHCRFNFRMHYFYSWGVLMPSQIFCKLYTMWNFIWNKYVALLHESSAVFLNVRYSQRWHL